MKFLLENASLSWLCLVAFFSFLELFFGRYLFLWMSVGATVGLIVSIFSGPYWLQIVLAITISAGLMWFCRNWIRSVRCEDAIGEILPPNEGNKTMDYYQTVENIKPFIPENPLSGTNAKVESLNEDTVQNALEMFSQSVFD